MKRILIAIFSFILIVIIATIIILRSSSGFLSINLVPDNAVLIAESNDPIQSWDEIIHSKAWKHLSTNPLLNDINTEIQSFDSLIKSNNFLMKLVGEKPVTISQHPTKNGKYDLLYIVEIGKAGMLKNHEKLISTFVNKDEYKVTSRKYKHKTIIEILDLEDREYYFLSFIQGKLLFSYDPTLVETSIDASEESLLGKNTKFLDVYSKVSGKGLINIYIGHKKLTTLLNSFSPEFKSDINSKVLQYTGLSFNITQNGLIQIKGYSSISDSLENIYRDLLQSGNIELKTANVIPKRLASMIKINFKNANDYFHSTMQTLSKDEYKSYCDNLEKIEKRFKINMEQNIFSWMNEEIVLLQTKPSNLGRKNEFAAVIHTNDSTSTAENLNFLWRQIKKNSPVKIRSVNYNGYKIDYVAFPGLLKMLFGKILDKIEKPYFTQIGNNVIISNHPQTIKTLIDDYQKGFTLNSSPDYDKFCKIFKNKPALFAYFEPPVLYYNMQDLLDTDSWIKFKKNKEYFTCFSQAGVAVNIYDDMLYFEINALYKPDAIHWNKEYYNTFDIASLFNTTNLASNDENPDNKIQSDTIPEIIIQQLDAEKQTEYFEDGSIKREIKIKNGLLHGSFREYFPNGKVKIKGDFDNGQPSGKWKYFDEEGNLIKTDKY